MLTQVQRVITVFVLGILFLTILPSNAQSQSRNRLSIRNRHESAKSESDNLAEQHLESIAKAVSDRSTRQHVSSEILSISDITQDDSYRVQTVLNSVSVFRRLPVYKIEVDKSMIMFMVNNPDSVVNIWEKLGISQISVKRVDENLYSVSDVAGTSGLMKKIWSNDSGVLYYLEGSYKGPLIANRIKGRALILTRFSAEKGESGAENVVCYVDTFLSLEQEFFDASVKLLFPMFGRVADNNLEQTLVFVRWYSDGCKSTPVSLAAFAMDLDKISYQTRQELARQTYMTAQRNGNVETTWSVAKPTLPQSQSVRETLSPPSATQSLAQSEPDSIDYPFAKQDEEDTVMDPVPEPLDSIEDLPTPEPPALEDLTADNTVKVNDSGSDESSDSDTITLTLEFEDEVTEPSVADTKPKAIYQSNAESDSLPNALPVLDEPY